MNIEFVRNPYNYDSDLVSEETGLECKDESLTEQEHAQEADINYIAERFMRTGEMPQVLQLPTAGDFNGIFDFQTAMNQIAQAKLEFMKLPAKIRSRFENDPAQLLEFVQDESNYDEAVKLGFIEKRATIEIPPTQENRNESGRERPTDQNPQRQTGADRADKSENTSAATRQS